MELPSLGESCHESSCKQLDFLPMKCDACANIYCRDHIHYNTHSCPESYKKDNQVPVCPLCNNPITVSKGALPDVVVGRHIDNDCQSDLAKKRRKIYTNRCSFKGCKQKELIPVNCEKCHKNFCLKHRHELDHDCKGFENTGRGVSRAAAAAVNRAGTSNQPKTTNKPNTSQGKPQNTMLSYLGKDLERERRERQPRQISNNLQTVQTGMTEDEALAHAIQMSMQESQGQQQAPPKPLTRQEEEDLALAQAIAASQQEAQVEQRRRRQQSEQNKTSCSLS